VIKSEAKKPVRRVRTFPNTRIAMGIPNPVKASPAAIPTPIKIPAMVLNFL
jgi:hypothetical protein